MKFYPWASTMRCNGQYIENIKGIFYDDIPGYDKDGTCHKKIHNYTHSYTVDIDESFQGNQNEIHRKTINIIWRELPKKLKRYKKLKPAF